MAMTHAVDGVCRLAVSDDYKSAQTAHSEWMDFNGFYTASAWHVSPAYSSEQGKSNARHSA
ncbi:hypothetical protein CHELA40_30140 [Chelatococcus asaccharovorans]|nr:hypothetical protein CHELA17_40274 [Chelatococcus asaccharovorans]CAH1688070.1 hypothetical protein CHELA40_30140 [Chelatococcus asaccharovorans]